MNFDKVINNMQELQSKIEDYELKNKKVDDAISSIRKDIVKVQRKINNSKNEINKHFLNIKVLLMEDIIKRFDFSSE